MAIRAYNELYIESAQRVLGDAFDFAIVTLCINPSDYEKMLISSDAMLQFEAGNPAYVCGINGCQLTRTILTQSGYTFHDCPDEMYIDKSPEFWCGWILAYYQWYTDRHFKEILSTVGISDLLKMYPVYHETDVQNFISEINKRIEMLYPLTRLRMYRENCNLSQSELAKLSDVSLRQIQMFEQRQRDINKTGAITLYKLSKALHCNMDDLIEVEVDSI